MLTNPIFRSSLAAIIFAVLAYLVVWNTYIGILGDMPVAYSTAAPQLAPTSGENLIRGSVTRDGRSLVPDNRETNDRIARGNRLNPLNPSPYVWKSRALASQEQFEDAIALLEFAKKRNPRSYPVRRLLAEYYLLTNDMGESLQEMFSSALLNPSWGAQFMEAVRLLGNNKQLQPEVIEKIASEPDWTNRFFAQLDPEKADDPFVIELSKKVPPIPRYRKQLIGTLAKKKKYAEAYSLWLQDIGSRNPISQWPYDPDFNSKPGPAPFNWKITNNANARAEMERSSAWDGEQALYAYYFGRQRTRIAEQVMMNVPGYYVFSIPYKINSYEGRAIRMKWEVVCVPGNEKLAETILEKESKEEGTMVVAFTVPSASCGAQSLRLLGEAGGRTGQMDVEFRSVGSSSKPAQKIGDVS